jgi:hypothetical protein
MKKLKLFTVVLAAVLLMPVASHAADQFGVDPTASPSGYVHANVVTQNLVSVPFLVLGSSTTNLPVTMARLVPVPTTGFGWYLRTGGTNAADTTNLTVTLEGVIRPTSSTTQVVDNATIVVKTPAVASALPTGYDYLTNFTPYITSGTELLRCDAVRIRSIQNTNLNSIWISNMFQIRNSP